MINNEINGFLLVYKEKGWTSRDVCNKIRKKFSISKVGHSGTLDPFAEGLLIIALNKATKLLPYVKDEPKVYEATLFLGAKTDTGDLSGTIIEEKPFVDFDDEKLAYVLRSFIGEQEQIPPMTSAIHVNGVKLYTLAHQGLEIERKPRKIRVFDLKLLKKENNIITFRCEVSKGTYIRTLGEDIASKLDNVGHLISLKRTNIDSINVVDAKSIADISSMDVLPMDEFLTLEKYYLSTEEYKIVLHGNPIKLETEHDDTILFIFDNEDIHEVVAVYQKREDGKYYSIRGIKVL